jgi:hypothetical protein
VGCIAPSDPKGVVARCDLFVHDGPSRCVHVMLVQFHRSLTSGARWRSLSPACSCSLRQPHRSIDGRSKGSRR